MRSQQDITADDQVALQNTPYQFKFEFLDEDGESKNFMPIKGSFDGHTLTLGKKETPIPLDQILGISRYMDELLIDYIDNNKSRQSHRIKMPDEKAVELHHIVNVELSQKHVRKHYQKLERLGREDEFDIQICPHCEASLITTTKENTPQLYCWYCDKFITLDNEDPLSNDYRICQHCGLFAKNRHSSIFKFFEKIVGCNACIRSKAWRMLWTDSLYIVVAPLALLLILRTYSKHDSASKGLEDLEYANTLFRKKNYDQASQLYTQIIQQNDYCAGVHYNHGLALMRAEQFEDAAVAFELALQDCSTFYPAVHQLIECYDKLEMPQESAALKQPWDMDEEENCDQDNVLPAAD